MTDNRQLYERDKELISDVMKLRFYPLNVATASGSKVYDVEGKEYVDMSAAWAVMNLGYNHPAIIAAVTEEMSRLSFSSLISTISEESLDLAQMLVDMMPGDFPKKVWYGHSGSDANEFLAKILPIATGRRKIITFEGSYHGQTLGSYEMSGHPALTEFQKAESNVIKSPYPYCYRCPCECEEGSCNLECMERLKQRIAESDSTYEEISAVVIEAAQSDGGDVAAPVKFVQALDRFCKEHGIYLIFDEVKIGFGRTGQWFGFQHARVIPDAVVLGKPLGEGQPISAVVGRKELMDAAVCAHLFTTAGNPVACKAAIATIETMEQEEICGKSQEMSAYIRQQLEALKCKYDIIGDVRNFGMLFGIELVTDVKSRKPDAELATTVVYHAYELGMLCYYTGLYSNVIEFTPPLVLTKEEADKAIAILDQTIADALAGNVDMDKVREFAGWTC